MATTNISIRMDATLKKEADQLFSEMGMNISTAFNIFVRQAIRERAIPFQIQLGNPNRETIAAMLERYAIKYSSQFRKQLTGSQSDFF